MASVVAIELPGRTAAALQRLESATGQSSARVVARALELLDRALRREALKREITQTELGGTGDSGGTPYLTRLRARTNPELAPSASAPSIACPRSPVRKPSLSPPRGLSPATPPPSDARLLPPTACASPGAGTVRPDDPKPGLEFPPEAMAIVARNHSPAARGILKHVCRRYRDEVHMAEKRTGRTSRIRVADLCLTVEALKWARAQGCPWDWRICMEAAWVGSLSVLQWARANGCPWNSRACQAAARMGHLDVLQWARGAGCDWDESVCEAAARGGHLEILEYAREQLCPWNEFTCWGAAVGGHREVLEWVRSYGCKWSEKTCYGAVKGGHLLMLQWLLENGCPWNKERCLDEARIKGLTHMAEWIQCQDP